MARVCPHQSHHMEQSWKHLRQFNVISFFKVLKYATKGLEIHANVLCLHQPMLQILTHLLESRVIGTSGPLEKETHFADFWHTELKRLEYYFLNYAPIFCVASMYIIRASYTIHLPSLLPPPPSSLLPPSLFLYPKDIQTWASLDKL